MGKLLKCFCDQEQSSLIEVIISQSALPLTITQEETFDFILIDDQYFESQKDLIKENLRNSILISKNSSEENIGKYFDKVTPFHIIGNNETDFFAIELESCLKKLCTRDIWGIEKYLQGEVDIKKRDITNKDELNNTISNLVEAFRYDSCFDSPKDYFKLIGNELATNALKNQTNNNIPEISMGMDSNQMLLSVRDFAGTLDRQKLLESLKRSFESKTYETKESGAGLGLYLTFLHSNRLVINISPGVSTEVICIIDRNKRFKKYKTRIKSLHFFEEVNI